ncbi:MAG: glycosyltransferase family 9 protein [Candidatus Eisenbacteria bacterium]|uniref:Glycosyltransferase family 9 protein n=1 Tax=Eiseniibacteriota bacterium TaxID=2212470 RepID=A0A538TZ66_UNCEI|nr:MAG: glycosyltransferase family 9 protein [Candidatus Eisenbacteria bacterium]
MTPSARRLHLPFGGFQRIAVLRLSSLGDVVLTLPVVHALARAYPRARLSYWVKEEYADVVQFDPAVSHVRRLERDARRLEDLVSMSAELEDADLIVDLHGNARTRVLTFRQKAPRLRAPSHRLARAALVHARWLRYPPPPHALARFAAALKPLEIAVPDAPRMTAGPEAERRAELWMERWAPPVRPVAMLPGARHFTKRWPEESWIELHDRLSAAGRTLLYASLDAERAQLPGLAARVAATATARWCTEPLAILAAVLARASAAITSDSGLMHVAAARGLPVVALFGSTAPELGFAPAGEGHVVLCRHERC